MKRGTDIPLLLIGGRENYLDVKDAVTSPRYMREPLLPSLYILEISHVSNHKSSITLRCFNKSFALPLDCGCKVTEKILNKQGIGQNIILLWISWESLPHCDRRESGSCAYSYLLRIIVTL